MCHRQALATATGIKDTGAIDRLIEQGISAETLASVGLIPLVAVAWADEKMDDKDWFSFTTSGGTVSMRADVRGNGIGKF